MSDIEEPTYSQLREENERLKAQNEQLSKLCLRAADALAEEFGEPRVDLSQKSPWNLIAELRKAV